MDLPFPVKVLYHALFLLHFYTHTLLSYLYSFGTICWHIGRLISNTSNIFRIFTDSFLFIKCIEAICHPLLHQRGVPTAGWGSFFALFCFLLAGLLFSLLSRLLAHFLLFRLRLLHQQRALFQLIQTDLPKQLLEVGLAADFFYLTPVPLEPVNATSVCKEADHIRTRVSAGQTSFRPTNRHFFPVKIARLGPANRKIARQAV